jgi:peptide methionine sulfoxide reductase msrA/msrB
MERTEVRSKSSDSHLGHVFDDGLRRPANVLRQFPAMRFIPVDKLKEKATASISRCFSRSRPRNNSKAEKPNRKASSIVVWRISP